MKLGGIGVIELGFEMCWWSESALVMFGLKGLSSTGSILVVPLWVMVGFAKFSLFVGMVDCMSMLGSSGALRVGM